METLETYKEKQLKLHAKILKNVSKSNRLKNGYNMLGVLKGNDIIVKSQEEAGLAFDFNIYEKVEDGKSATQLFLENFKTEDEVEAELLKNMTNAPASLYRIEDINKEQNTLILEDLLNSEEKVTIVDNVLVNECTINSIIFARIIKLENLNLTSGIYMVFDGNHKDYLLRKSKKNIKKISVGDEEIKKFISFFQLYGEGK